MIAGDPDIFCVCWDEVPAWSTPSIKNGLLSMIVLGGLVGSNFYRAALGPELVRMRGIIFDLSNATVIFNSSSSKIDLYQEFKRQLESEGKDNSRFCLISPWALVDAGRYIFHAFNDDGTERILFAEHGTEVQQIVVAQGTVKLVFQLAVDTFSA